MGNPGRTAGIGLAVIGGVLLLVGFLAYIWEVPRYGHGIFEGVLLGIDYPYRGIGTGLIVMGFISLVIGIILFAIQDYLKRPLDEYKQAYYQPPQQRRQQLVCSRCRNPITFIEPEQKWYCSNCMVYLKSHKEGFKGAK